MKSLYAYGARVNLVSMLVVLALVAVLSGCATRPEGQPPTSNDVLLDIAVQSATLIAVDRVVTRDHASQAEIEARAGRILLIASSLKALGSDKLSTLPTIRAALNPLLDKASLTALERAQADLLVNALVAVALERTDVSKYVARVEFVLDELIKAASVYLPAAAPAPTS